MELLVYILFAAIVIFPMWKLCERAGLNPMWSLVSAIPLGLLVLLYVLALREWPGDRGRAL
jgi:hypothetical protein